MQRSLAHGLALLVLVAGLGAAQSPQRLEATPAPNRTDQGTIARTQAGQKARAYQVGTASWYGEDFDGKPTASGEPYDMYDMTAASLTIPLGTYVKVTNLHNGRAVVVKVDDLRTSGSGTDYRCLLRRSPSFAVSAQGVAAGPAGLG